VDVIRNRGIVNDIDQLGIQGYMKNPLALGSKATTWSFKPSLWNICTWQHFQAMLGTCQSEIGIGPRPLFDRAVSFLSCERRKISEVKLEKAVLLITSSSRRQPPRGVIQR
jgi:hypothetical protein